MPQIKGTKTEQNLRAAVAGESQARVKYEFFASRAEKEGLLSIAKQFREISDNERAHCKIWFDALECMGTTDKNLEHSAESESYESTVMYKGFAQTARSEGFEELALRFEMVGAIEDEHRQTFESLRSELEAGQISQKPTEVEWICSNCGHRHKGLKAPQVCPVCSHEQKFFTVAPSH